MHGMPMCLNHTMMIEYRCIHLPLSILDEIMRMPNRCCDWDYSQNLGRCKFTHPKRRFGMVGQTTHTLEKCFPWKRTLKGLSDLPKSSFGEHTIPKHLALTGIFTRLDKCPPVTILGTTVTESDASLAVATREFGDWVNGPAVGN